MYFVKAYLAAFSVYLLVVDIPWISSACLENAVTYCSFDSQCCSKVCSKVSKQRKLCRNEEFKNCAGSGESCDDHSNCCSRRCEEHDDGSKSCYGAYEITSSTCLKADESCTKSIDCCSKVCDRENNVCKYSDYETCVSTGSCVRNEDCCSLNCVLKSSGYSICQGGDIDGVDECREEHDSCEVSSQCCDGFCDKVGDEYKCILYKQPSCLSNVEYYCMSSKDCCDDGVCLWANWIYTVCRNKSFRNCRDGGYKCSTDDDCCSRRCEGSHMQGGSCVADVDYSRLSCKKAGEKCWRYIECCSKNCDYPDEYSDMQCLGNEYVPCTAEGKFCSSNRDCCSGSCTLPFFSRYPKCNGPDPIVECIPDGEACEDSMRCCNGLCDFNFSETMICIPYIGDPPRNNN